VTEIITMVALTVQTLILTIIVVSVYRLSRHMKLADQAQAARESTAAKVPTPHITPEELERLRKSTQEVFEKAVNDSAEGFHADLAATSQKLNELITRLTTQVVERELDEYRQGLTAARQQALGSLQEMQTAVQQKQKSLEADVDSELAKRQAFLIERLDQRLGAAVAAYIVESLGQGADLGAQRTFLLENLERHKEELKKEVSGGGSS
jgi:uncharacterized protein YbjQ (UPF0145 family)